MLNPTYPIETDRLLLCPCPEADLDDLADILGHADVVRSLYWEVQSREEVAEKIARRGDDVAIELKEAGTVIGDVVLQWLSEEHKQGETGFVFHPDYHGKGYAPEAARVMLKPGFEELGLHRIIGRCDARNAASARLMERLGMRREAHFRENEWFKGEWGDEMVFAMLASEWEARWSRVEQHEKLSCTHDANSPMCAHAQQPPSQGHGHLPRRPVAHVLPARASA